MKPALIDVETLFYELMSAAAPEGVTVIQDQHADTGGDVPFVSWSAINNGQYAHGLWSITLTLSVVAEPLDMFRISHALYNAIRGWSIPGEGVLPGVGGVNTVTDGVVFDRVGQTRVHGKYLVQAAATFQITVEDMS